MDWFNGYSSKRRLKKAGECSSRENCDYNKQDEDNRQNIMKIIAAIHLINLEKNVFILIFNTFLYLSH